MKTIEEASNEAYIDTSISNDQLFNEGVEFAQRWIPVEEEMPEHCLPVIDGKFVDEVICKGCYTNSTTGHMLLQRMKNPNSGWNWNCGPVFTVTHWRPIEYK